MIASEKEIKLKAQGEDDITVLSSLVQDAIIDHSDIAWLEADNQFVMVMNRFCWEKWEEGAKTGNRTHAALRVDNVTHIQKRGFGPHGETDYLSLLSLAFYAASDETDDGNVLVLHFSGDRCIKLAIQSIAVILSDLGDNWPTHSIPNHQDM